MDLLELPDPDDSRVRPSHLRCDKELGAIMTSWVGMDHMWCQQNGDFRWVLASVSSSNVDQLIQF